MAAAGRNVPAALLAVLLLAPLASAQGPPAHENFQRAATDVEALRGLGETLLNTTESALAHTLAADDVNASRRARLGEALTSDLALIAGASDIESASYLAPLVHPYTSIAQNTTNLTRGFMLARSAGDPRLVPLVRVQTLGMLGDADNFDALGFGTARLRELISLLLLDLDRIETLSPAPPRPFMVLVADPPRVTLGERVLVRGVMDPPPAEPVEVRLALDGAPWRTARVDANGAFAVAYDVPADARLGAHRVDAEARASGPTLRANTTFQVLRLTTLLTLAPERASYAPQDSVVLRARLLDGERQPIAGAQAVLQVDDEAPVNVTFRSDGSALLRFDAGSFALGPHEASLAYAGDATHDAASAETRWIVAVPQGGAPPRPGETGGGGGPRPVEPDAPPAPPATDLAWLAWIGSLLLVLAAEEGARRLVAARWPASHAEAKRRAVLERLAPMPRGVSPSDPEGIVILAYRDVLLALSHEGARVDRMTHLEVARALEARGRDPAAVKLVTETFERVRYARERVPSGTLGAYLPSVLRLTKPGGA